METTSHNSPPPHPRPPQGSLPRPNPSAHGLWSKRAMVILALCLPIILRAGGYLWQSSPTVPGLIGEDQLGQVWLLWWTKQALIEGLGSFLHTTYLNYPEGVSTLAGFGFISHALLSIPLQLWLSPVAAMNALLLGTLLWSAACVYLLCHQVARSRIAAVVCALLCTLSPWNLDRLELLGMSSEFFDLGSMALCLLFLRRARLQPTRRWGLPALAALFFFLAFWTEAHHGIYLALMVLILAIWELARSWAGDQRSVVVSRFTIFGVTAGLACAPWAWTIVSTFSEHSPLLSAPLTRAAGQPAGQLAQAPPSFLNASLIFSLLILLALVVAGCRMVSAGQGRGRALLWLIMSLVGGLISIGPALVIPLSEGTFNIPCPFAILRGLLPFMCRDLWPDRWFQLSMLAQAVGLAYIFRALITRIKFLPARRMAWVVLVAAVYIQHHLHSVGTAPRFLPPEARHAQLWSLPAARPLPRLPAWLKELRKEGGGAVLHLPRHELLLDGQDKGPLWLSQTIHQRPMINKLIPTALALQHRAAALDQAVEYLEQLVSGGQPGKTLEMVERLRKAGVEYILVHRRVARTTDKMVQALGSPVLDSEELAAFRLRQR